MKHVFSVCSIACVAFFTILLSTTNSGCKKGDDGAKGDPGTANVLYSNWTDVNFNYSVQSPGDTIWTATLPATGITKGILDTGMVKVFLNVNTSASPTVYPLPIAGYINVSFTTGNINLIAAEDVSSFTTTGGLKAWQYRYVIIPGGTKTGRSSDYWNNYENVKELYGLTD